MPAENCVEDGMQLVRDGGKKSLGLAFRVAGLGFKVLGSPVVGCNQPGSLLLHPRPYLKENIIIPSVRDLYGSSLYTGEGAQYHPNVL